MGLLATEERRKALLHAMATLARQVNEGGNGSSAGVAGGRVQQLPPPVGAAIIKEMDVLPPPLCVTISTLDSEDCTPTPSNITEGACRTEGEQDDTEDESIMYTVAVLRRLQQQAESEADNVVMVRKDEVDQIMRGFSKALEFTASTWDERRVGDTMQKLFRAHANVFDEKMQNFFMRNFIQESDCAKTFRAAVRRTSLVRRCLVAMYPSESKKIPERSKWSNALLQRAAEERSQSIEVCPDVKDPSVVLAVKTEIANLSCWGFNIFVIAEAVPNQSLSIVGNALLEQYDLCRVFRSSKTRVHAFLRQIDLRYHCHPYHNAEHAADVAQTLHYFFAVGELGEFLSPRNKCAAMLAAIVHDVGHTSYTNNFHISVNDDLAVQYVYRSPLEHMHCALTFQLLKDPKCNILEGLTKIEQQEVRSLVTEMVLATDNSVHSAYLAKLEGLVCRSTDDSWKLSDPDDEKLILQMALHAADVSNPAKPLPLCMVWAERIKKEFYQQGDKERELELPVSIGCDRANPIPLEKMQAGFIIGIVRPLFDAMCRIPKAKLSPCLTQLDENLVHWKSEIKRRQSTATASEL